MRQSGGIFLISHIFLVESGENCKRTFCGHNNKQLNQRPTNNKEETTTNIGKLSNSILLRVTSANAKIVSSKCKIAVDACVAASASGLHCNCGWFEVIVSVTCLPHTHAHTYSHTHIHTNEANQLHCSLALFGYNRERNSFTFSRSFEVRTSVVIVVAIIVVFGNFDRQQSHVECIYMYECSCVCA